MQAIRQLGFGQFLDMIGEKSPAPGGGAVASAAGALAAALAKMVVAYSLGKKNLAEHQPALERASATLTRTIDMLMQLASEDAEAYGLLNELSKLPPEDPRRLREYASAVDASIGAPRAVLGVCCDLLRLLEPMTSTTNRHLRSDLAIAAILAEAAGRSAWWNVRMNLSLISDEAQRAGIEREGERMLADALKRSTSLQEACAA